MCLLTYTLQCSYLPHCISSSCLDVLIPPFNRGKERDVQESSKGAVPVISLLLTKLYDIA